MSADKRRMGKRKQRIYGGIAGAALGGLFAGVPGALIGAYVLAMNAQRRNPDHEI